jgi:hypothetical protein
LTCAQRNLLLLGGWTGGCAVQAVYMEMMTVTIIHCAHRKRTGTCFIDTDKHNLDNSYRILGRQSLQPSTLGLPTALGGTGFGS